MSVDHIRYDLLTQQALRAVVRRVLSDVAKAGSLPGEHHFYVTFDTRAPGVKLSSRMREQYPEEMTIVLQHQFWDLAVSDAHFEVALSFNGVSEKLHVPFEAIKGFFDPSVQFGLQFEPQGEAAARRGREACAWPRKRTTRPRRKPVRRGRRAGRGRPGRARKAGSAEEIAGRPGGEGRGSARARQAERRRRSGAAAIASGRNSLSRADKLIRIGRPLSGRKVMRANGITCAPSASVTRKRRAIIASASSVSCIAKPMPTQMRAPAPNGR